MKSGLFPAATTARTSGPAPAETGEAFHDELVRRRGDQSAKADKATKAEAASNRRAEAQRAEKPKGAKSARTRRKESAQEDAAAPDETQAAREPAPAESDAATQPVPKHDRKPFEAEAPSDEGAEDVDDGAAAATVALTPSAPNPLAHSPEASGGEAPVNDLVAAERVDTVRAAVYHAVPSETDAGEAGDAAGTGEVTTSAPQDGLPGLFDDAPGQNAGDAPDDTTDPHPGAAASAAVSDAAPEVGSAGALAEVSGETRPTPSITDGTSSAAAVTAHFSDGDFHVPGAPHRPRSDVPSPAATTPTPPEVRFAEANHANIVTSMRGELLPNGGSMRIRLDPPQLGALQVTVQIRDGLVTAAFETSSDEATRLLGHSLNHLKSVLESHGVAVDKLQVQQAPREAQAQAANDDARREQGGQSQEQEQSARQEQQRREMLRRMWRRLAGEQDPLDLTA